MVIAAVAGIVALGMFVLGKTTQWDFVPLAFLASAVILAILACLVTDLRWIGAMIGLPVVLLMVLLCWESHDCGFGSGILKGLAQIYVGLLCLVLGAIWLIRFIIQRKIAPRQVSSHQADVNPPGELPFGRWHVHTSLKRAS